MPGHRPDTITIPGGLMHGNRVQVLTPLEKESRMVGDRLPSRRFSGVDFSDTVFARANCVNAVFIDVDLRRADFREALLSNVLFLGCDCEGAEFASASVTRARFIACSGLGPETIRLLRQGGADLSDDQGNGVATRVRRVLEAHERLRKLDQRAASVYRTYAQGVAMCPELYTLWEDVARYKEDRARALGEPRDELGDPPAESACDGAEDALADLEGRLLAAERLTGKGSADGRLMAALDIEVIELEVRHRISLAYSAQEEKQGLAIAVRLASMVPRYCDEVHLFLEAAQLISRARRESCGRRRM